MLHRSGFRRFAPLLLALVCVLWLAPTSAMATSFGPSILLRGPMQIGRHMDHSEVGARFPGLRGFRASAPEQILNILKDPKNHYRSTRRGGGSNIDPRVLSRFMNRDGFFYYVPRFRVIGGGSSGTIISADGSSGGGVVPEPSTGLLMLLGLAGLAGHGRRRARQQA